MSKQRLVSLFAVVAILLLAACRKEEPIPTLAPTAAPVGPPASSPEPGVEPTAVPGEVAGAIDPADIRLDTQGLCPWQANAIEGTSYDESMPPGPKGLPDHTVVNLCVTDPAGYEVGLDPIIYVIPIQAYENLWSGAGNDSVAADVEHLKEVLADRPDPESVSLPVLPKEEVLGQADIIAHKGYVDAEQFSGMRFVTRFSQGPNPLINPMRYVFQGLSNDGQYLVSMFYNVSTGVLPFNIEEVPPEELQQVDDDPQAYNEAQVEKLNDLAPSDWDPDLEDLDALIASLNVSAEPVEDLVWAKIQESGRIFAGTSADYPPFAYYGEGYAFAGLDIDIIREIGRRLDLDVEIIDFAFEGLGDALTLGQIDVAIAAISVTPERAGAVNFSNVYFVSRDAILARSDVQVVINSVENLAPFRVGVQSGTVYEDWLEESLVDTGLMDPANLFLFVEAGEMIDDLRDRRIDFVIGDLQPIQLAAQSEDLTIVAEGLNRQLFAIAMPLEANELQAEINRVLTEMINDGTLADLIEEHLDIPAGEILPPEGELPEPIPPEPSECIDGMAFVADLSYDDKNMTVPPTLQPGQPFQKGWRLRNVGSCIWDAGYKLGYVSGNVPAARMGGLPTTVQGTVAPGQTYDMWVDLVAPAIPGTYQAFWQMFNSENEPFGQRVWVGIGVGFPPTATPPPTQTPSPNIQFASSPTSIEQGDCSTLNWATSNVQAVYVYEQGQPWQNYGVPGTGQRAVCPATTTTYEMRVVYINGSVEIRQVAVFVTPVTGAPIITRFTAEPRTIAEGQCVNLKWIIDGRIDDVAIIRNSTAIFDPAPVTGSMTDCPPGIGEQTYTLETSGPGGTSRQTCHVQVIQPTEPPPAATATPLPTATTPAPQPPVIDYFSALPSQIEVNQCVSIAWGVGGGATRIQIKRDSAVILDNAPFNGTIPDCPEATGTVIYSVVATNNAGDTVSDQQSVTVTESVPENPLANSSWQLSALNINQVPIPGTTVTAFFSENGTLSGNGGCNSYNSTYTLQGSTLSIGQISSSGALCGEDVDTQEQTYLAVLQTAASFVLEDGQLVIFDASGTEIIRYNQLLAVPT